MDEIETKIAAVRKLILMSLAAAENAQFTVAQKHPIDQAKLDKLRNAPQRFGAN